ncbi:carbonate dehydratase [Sinimarinibacterium thermocellulolyticum]|uniref:carbonic anhydrase n=1 Tax=Sinimarinibacterium thermocellulolyticum TaxID=3170016 RepID=A0ABV2AC24_9GAMM
MNRLDHLLEQNAAWAAARVVEDPDFFRRLAGGQKPAYLWIGCADSRVPANQLLNLPPGEVFVHRNIANVVVHSDFNCLSVMQFAVEVLKVRHILVVGHYGCSGVHAALHATRIGIADNWLRHIRDVADRHRERLDRIADERVRHDRLCELNVVEQVLHVCQSTVVEDAWARGQSLSVHGWVYGLHDGRLRDLGLTMTAPDDVRAAHQRACDAILGPYP